MNGRHRQPQHQSNRNHLSLAIASPIGGRQQNVLYFVTAVTAVTAVVTSVSLNTFLERLCRIFTTGTEEVSTFSSLTLEPL
ncbi:hypothetical protein MY11210_003161 [Beauveria gryllotalpidicola]